MFGGSYRAFFVPLFRQNPGLQVQQFVSDPGFVRQPRIQPCEGLFQIQTVIEIERGGLKIKPGRFFSGDAMAASTCDTTVLTTSTSSLMGTRVFSHTRLSVADSSRISLKSIVNVSTGSASFTGVALNRARSFSGL